MTKFLSKFYIWLMVLTILAVFVLLVAKGVAYYNIDLENRFFDPMHEQLKPGGSYGHGYGIFGSLLLLIGVGTYMLRKRVRIFSRAGYLKYWLEFHIFLCTLGPLLILFHTSFKFGGIVSISFWSMVAVFLSGIVGRFIYIQIPRTLEGRELSLEEAQTLKNDLVRRLKANHNLDEAGFEYIMSVKTKRLEIYHSNGIIRFIKRYRHDQTTLKAVKQLFKSKNIPLSEAKQLLDLVKNDISLSRKIEMLETMQRLFNYWHVAHLPFAVIMLLIMIVHVIITIMFGYQWIF